MVKDDFAMEECQPFNFIRLIELTVLRSEIIQGIQDTRNFGR